MRIWERERRLGLLFISVLFAFPICISLALGFPDAARVAGVSLLVILCVFAARHLERLRHNKSLRAPVGPLSPDEKTKARSKLLKARTQT